MVGKRIVVIGMEIQVGKIVRRIVNALAQIEQFSGHQTGKGCKQGTDIGIQQIIRTGIGVGRGQIAHFSASDLKPVRQLIASAVSDVGCFRSQDPGIRNGSKQSSACSGKHIKRTNHFLLRQVRLIADFPYFDIRILLRQLICIFFDQREF